MLSLRHSRLRGDLGVWEHSGVTQATGVPAPQRSAVPSPSEIGIRLKQGVCSLGPYRRRAVGGGASGILENPSYQAQGAACKEPSRWQLLRAGVLLTDPAGYLGLGGPGFPSLVKKEDEGLHTGLLLM